MYDNNSGPFSVTSNACFKRPGVLYTDCRSYSLNYELATEVRSFTVERKGA